MRRKMPLLIFIIFISCFVWFNFPLTRGNVESTIYSEDFTSPVTDWTLSIEINNWSVGSPPFGDHGGTGEALGTNIDGNYTDNVDEQIEARSPVINLEDRELINIELSFYHWYNFSNSLNDGGGIYLWDGSNWFNPLNDYPSAISGDTNVEIISGLAYTGHPNEIGWAYNSSKEWREVIIDLSAINLDNSDFQISYVFGEKDSDTIHGQGWYIDDIQITGEKLALEKNELQQEDYFWIWLILIMVVIAGTIGIGIYFIYKYKLRRDLGGHIDDLQEGDSFEIGGDTPGAEESATPSEGSTSKDAKKPPTTTTKPTTTKTKPKTIKKITTKPKKAPPKGKPSPAIVTKAPPPNITWKRLKRADQTDNPLDNYGYTYEIVFAIPCRIKPKPNEVIVARVELTITVTCNNKTHPPIKYDYWEAFRIDPTTKEAISPDKHDSDHSELRSIIREKTGCRFIDSYKIDRKHTVNIGEVQGENWEQSKGGHFAYILNGPPPENKKSNPSNRDREGVKVQGNVARFSTTGATVFTSTYTYNDISGKSTFTSSLNPGKTYTHPP